MNRKRGAIPRTKIEHISKLAVTTNISSYFLEGANISQVRERAPDEIQAGQFDVILSNHDDNFSEMKVGSLLADSDYHGDKIKVSRGFLLPDGTEEYDTQAVGFIDELTTDSVKSRVTLRCRDIMWRIMDQKIHARPTVEIPAADSGNTGDGLMSSVETKPFSTVNQDWTITCTTLGGDGVGLFSVVGSVSGNIGTATSGTEFSSGASGDGVKFTIHSGSTVWAEDDFFTFTTKQYPEWDDENAGKIIWSILTGYDWDSDTQQNFSDLVFDFDRTQSSANTDLDYDSFNSTITDLTNNAQFDIKGFVPYDQDAVEFIQGITLLFLGSLFTGNDGRIKLKALFPTFGSPSVTFKDSEKVSEVGYTRTVDEIINSVSVKYKQTDTWFFSDEQDVLDGFYGTTDSDSIIKYHELGTQFNVAWFAIGALHVVDFAGKLVGKFKEPPFQIGLKTGMDAITTEIADVVAVTDEKLGMEALECDVVTINKNFGSDPGSIDLVVRREIGLATFGIIGSSENEGDGKSPQKDTFGSATATDKLFAYFSDVTVTTSVDYRFS